MSDEMKVQTKGINKKFIFITVTLIAVGLIAALVLLPTSAKAKKVEEQLDLGAKYLSELDYEQAIVAYEAVIKIDPKCEEAYLALADIYIATGAFEKAEEILKQAEDAIGADVTEAVEAKKNEVAEVREEQKTVEVPSPTPTSTLTNIPIPSPTELPTATPSPTVAPTSTPTPMLIMNWKDILEYRVEADQTATIIRAINKEVEEVIIPDEVDGYPVKKIQSYAFSDCTELENVEIPEGVVEIGIGVFQLCEKLEHLVIPSSVAKIEGNMTPLCGSLEEIIVNEGNDYYVSQDGILFDKDMKCLISVPSGKQIQEYRIPEGVTQIGEHAFDACGIEEVVFSESVNAIGACAFWNCYDLKELIFPQGITEIGKSIISPGMSLIISVDEENEFYCAENDVLFNKEKTDLMIFGNRLMEGRYEVPEGIEQISKSAFGSCALTEVVLPKSVTDIENWTFCYCDNLANIVLSDGIEIISAQMFEECINLEKIVIPDNVKEIRHNAFLGCNSLKEIVIPTSVISIDVSAFDGCDSVVIYTPSGSYVEQWAKENGVNVVAQ